MPLHDLANKGVSDAAGGIVPFRALVSKVAIRDSKDNGRMDVAQESDDIKN